MNKLLPIIAGVILAVTGFAASAAVTTASPELSIKETGIEQASKNKHKHKHKHKHHKHMRHHDRHHDDDYYYEQKRRHHKRGTHIVVH